MDQHAGADLILRGVKFVRIRRLADMVVSLMLPNEWGQVDTGPDRTAERLF